MGTKSGPIISSSDVMYSIDAGSERCFPRSDLYPYWADYSGGLQAGKYTLPSSDSLYLRNTSTSWVGRFEALMADSSTPYTIMFDYVADASSTLILDNDSVDDNQWNASISATTTKQTYSFTRTPAQTSATTKIQFYLRRNSGGNITVTNFRFFRALNVNNLSNVNVGVLTNNTSFSTVNGGTFSFDGTGDYINVANYTNHNNATQGSLEAWVKPTNNGGNRYAFGVGGTSTYGGSRAVRIAGGNWSLVGYGSGTEDWNDIATATTAWQHIVITWNGTAYCFYLDGVKYGPTTRTGTVVPLGSVLRIGSPPFATNDNFIGEIASFRHHRPTLTDAQVITNYNAQKTRFI